MTDYTKALVERLRHKCMLEGGSAIYRNMRLSPDPLCAEAADTIERLERELDEARRDARPKYEDSVSCCPYCGAQEHYFSGQRPTHCFNCNAAIAKERR